VRKLCALPLPRKADRSSIGWLHIAKTGTTFMNSVVHWACEGLPPSLSVANYVQHESEKGSPLATNAWAQLDRSHNVSMSCFSPRGRLIDRGRRTEGGWRPHVPSHAASEAPHLVTMLRRPAQRLASAFHHAGGPHGVPPADRTQLKSLSQFAKYCPLPSIGSGTGGAAGHAPTSVQCAANKQCAYVLGRACAGASDVREAIGRLRRYAFVGLSEHWHISVCLFHRRLGGAAVPAEFELTRPSTSVAKRSGWYDESELLPAKLLASGAASSASFSSTGEASSADPMATPETLDAVLYAFAQMRFLRELGEATGWRCALKHKDEDAKWEAEGMVEPLEGLRVPVSSMLRASGPPEIWCAAR